MIICFSSKFALGIPSVLSSFCPVIWFAISSLFHRDIIFFAVSNWKPILIIETMEQIGRYLIHYADNQVYVESAKWRAQRANVPYVPTCSTCPRSLRALRALRAHAPYVPYMPTYLSIFYRPEN